MTIDREVLLPCPFCGGNARRYTIGPEEPNNAGGDVICCVRCQASSHVEFGYKENLVSCWNRRTALDQPAQPSIWLRFSGDGQHIRKWDFKPFDGGVAYGALPGESR